LWIINNKTNESVDNKQQLTKNNMAKINLNKMCYTEFIEYLEERGIERTEETDIDTILWMDEYVAVTPIESNLKERYFSTDGGHQLL
jgi:hypothetical protein